MRGADVQPDLRRWEQPTGTLRLYEDYHLPTTDAPREYNIACGLAVHAALIGNNLHLPFGGQALRLNLWSLILGPSSDFRKSTTISQGRRTIRRLYDGQTDAAPLLPDEFSREALLKRLADRPQGLLTYSEFSGALATFARDYMSGTKETLADLYDGPATYERTIGAQTFTIRDACVSILAASQTEWFLEKLKAGDVRGGFLARFMFWPAFVKKYTLALPPEPDARIGSALVAGLNEVRQVKGAVELPADVRRAYERWLLSHEKELRGIERVADLSPFWCRLSVTTLKLAAILQVAHNRERAVTRDSLDRAIGLTEYLKASLRYLFAEEFAFSKPMQDRQRVLRYIRDHAGCKRRDILRNCNLILKDLWPVIGSLKEEGRITEGDGETYWPEGAQEPASPGAREWDGAGDCPDCGWRHSPDAECRPKVARFPA
jgi:hypothetical protein